MDDTRELESRDGTMTGDDEALLGLYRAYAQVVYNYGVRILRSPKEAGEVVSDVLLSLWAEKRGTFRNPRCERTWLLSRARTEILGRTHIHREDDPTHGIDLRHLVAGAKPAEGRIRRETVVAQAVAAVVRDLDYIRLKLLAMAYFGGRPISEIARRLELSPQECIKRLHQSLVAMDTRERSNGRHRRAHEVDFAGYTAPYALGILDGQDRTRFESHLAQGCPACDAEIRRLSDISHQLPLLLPDVALPADLIDKILFSFRLAHLVSASGASGIVPEGENPSVEMKVKSTSARRPRPLTWLLVLSMTVSVAAGLYVSFLLGVIEKQQDTIDLQQDKTASLLVANDRLSGISRFLADGSPIILLHQSEASPGITGRMLVDEGGRHALLQIFDLPGKPAGKVVEVAAFTGGGPQKIVEFPLLESDSGRVVQRIIPLDRQQLRSTGKVTVSVSDPGAAGREIPTTILEGEYAGRP